MSWENMDIRPDMMMILYDSIIAKKDSKVNLHYFDGDLLFFLFGDDYMV